MNFEKKLKLMFDVARRFAEESTCPRAKSGAIIFSRDFTVLTTGYNGSPRSTSHCDQVGCLILDGHCVRSSHSEANAIVAAARSGVSINNQRMASMFFPCPFCARLIIQSGIRRVYYATNIETYNEEHRKIVMTSFEEAGVQLIHWDK